LLVGKRCVGRVHQQNCCHENPFAHHPLMR
jgi:hypothetical protein